MQHFTVLLSKQASHGCCAHAEHAQRAQQAKQLSHLERQVSVEHPQRRPHHRHVGRRLEAALRVEQVITQLGRQQRHEAALRQEEEEGNQGTGTGRDSEAWLEPCMRAWQACTGSPETGTRLQKC